MSLISFFMRIINSVNKLVPLINGYIGVW
jgi:hypothetical protein